MFDHTYSGPCKYGSECFKKLCTYQHDNAEIDANEALEENFNEFNYNEQCEERTSTPKKANSECEDCANESELAQCVDCIVKRVSEGYGGRTTAPSTLASGSVGMGASSSSGSGCSGSASLSFS